MKRSHIILIVICVLLAACVPAGAACSKTVKKTTCQDTGCNVKSGSCTGDSCDAAKNSGDVCSANKVSKCSQTPIKNKACDTKAVKKAKCSGAPIAKGGCTDGCGKRTTTPVNEQSSTVDGVSPIVPSADDGTTTVKMCKDSVCTVGGNGKTLSLVNHADAVDPSYAQLIEFARADKTDETPYKSNSFVCSDFAKTFHDNAEAAGIKTGWVGVASCNHAFNVVNTTDQGIVYIDSTGQVGGGTMLDKELNYVKDSPLTGEYLFRDGTVQMGCNAGPALIYW